MARTKADAYAKAGGKTSRKTSIARPQQKSIKIKKGGSKGGGGGNPVVKRPVPKWQNPITDFFSKNDADGTENNDSEDVNAHSSTGLDEPGCSRDCRESGGSGEEEDLDVSNDKSSDGECEASSNNNEACETDDKNGENCGTSIEI